MCGYYSGDLDTIACIVGQATAVVLYIIGGYYSIRLMLTIFTGQIDLIGGKPGAIADMVQQMIFILLSFVFAIDAPRLVRGFAALADRNIGKATSNDIGALVYILEPVFLVIFNIVATLVITNFLVNFVIAAVKSQIGVATGSPAALSQGILSIITTVITLAVGLGLLRAGAWALASL